MDTINQPIKYVKIHQIRDRTPTAKFSSRQSSFQQDFTHRMAMQEELAKYNSKQQIKSRLRFNRVQRISSRNYLSIKENSKKMIRKNFSNPSILKAKDLISQFTTIGTLNYEEPLVQSKLVQRGLSLDKSSRVTQVRHHQNETLDSKYTNKKKANQQRPQASISTLFHDQSILELSKEHIMEDFWNSTQSSSGTNAESEYESGTVTIGSPCSPDILQRLSKFKSPGLSTLPRNTSNDRPETGLNIKIHQIEETEKDTIDNVDDFEEEANTVSYKINQLLLFRTNFTKIQIDNSHSIQVNSSLKHSKQNAKELPTLERKIIKLQKFKDIKTKIGLGSKKFL